MTTTETHRLGVEELRGQGARVARGQRAETRDAGGRRHGAPGGEMGSEEEKQRHRACQGIPDEARRRRFRRDHLSRRSTAARDSRARTRRAFNAEAARGYVLPTFPMYIGQGMCLPTIFTHGTEEQKKRFMPPSSTGRRSGRSCSASRAPAPTSPGCR